MTYAHTNRFITDPATGQILDTQVHPKVLRAEQEAERKRQAHKERAKSEGFAYPSKLELEERKKEEA